MQIEFKGDKPIYLQLAEGLEDAILKGGFPEEAQIPSTTELSVVYKINPATALKGINLLVEGGIVYKRRGLGMFVCEGATERILEKRKRGFYEDFILTLLLEAEKLGIVKEEIIEMIERGLKR